MNRSLPCAIFALCLLLPALARAQAVDVNLSDEAVRAEYQGRLESIGARFDLGGLIADENDDSNLVQTHAGLLITGDAGAREANVVAGLGGRMVLLDAGPIDGGGLALGGMLEARLPAFNRLGMLAYGYWAPRASSFGDLESHLEYAVSLDYEVIRKASVYVGFRQVRLDLENGPRVTAETGFHFGLRLKF